MIYYLSLLLVIITGIGAAIGKLQLDTFAIVVALNLVNITLVQILDWLPTLFTWIAYIHDKLDQPTKGSL